MSHLSSVGFHVESEDELNDLLEQAYSVGKSVNAEEGLYVQFSDPSGSELWMQVNTNSELVGLNPHFAGKGRMTVGLVRLVDGEQEDPMDGAFYAWANPSDMEAEEPGDFPFVFDLPNFCTVKNMALPSIKEVQISAFAQQLDCFESDEEFLAAQPEEMRLAPESFLPVGLYEEEDGDMPLSYGLINGHVLEVAKIKNELTGQLFQWMLIKTIGGTIDLVCKLDLLDGQTIKKGGVVNTIAWLSGRFV